MSNFKSEFSWSISRDRIFQIWPRQYYFNYYGYWLGWEINVPLRVKQIYILKQLKNRYMWVELKVSSHCEKVALPVCALATCRTIERLIEAILTESLTSGCVRERGEGSRGPLDYPF